MKREFEKPYVDIWLAAVFFLLILFGIIMVYSASAYYAEARLGDPEFYLKKHILWVFIGLVGMAIAYRIPYRRLQGVTGLLLLLAIVVLGYAALVQRNRWITLGPIHFQAVDVAKFSIILFFADSLSRKEKDLRKFTRGYLPHLLILLFFSFLVVLQPDFSSAFMLVMIGLTLLFVSPIKLQHLFLTGALFAPLSAIAIWISNYKINRIQAFLHPELDLQGKGYQIYQSLVSLGAGGINGVGLAKSTQKLFFLPEAHTDYIFSIIGEELGLKGTLFVVILFAIIMFRGIKIARRSSDRFSFYLTVGITAHLVLYALVHMMVVAHLMPPTGLPLPFVSYGGTALFFSCVYGGLLLNIARETLSPVAVRHQEFARYAIKRVTNLKRGRKR